jgi:hypothetical protein
LVLLQVRLDVETSAVLHRCTFVPADEFQFGFLLLTSTLYFQLGCGSGLDVINLAAVLIFISCNFIKHWSSADFFQILLQTPMRNVGFNFDRPIQNLQVANKGFMQKAT